MCRGTLGDASDINTNMQYVFPLLQDFRTEKQRPLKFFFFKHKKAEGEGEGGLDPVQPAPQTKLKTLVKSVDEIAPPKSLSRRYDWPVKKSHCIVDLPIRMKGNSKCISSNSLSPEGAQNKDFGAALQTLLTEFKLRLRRRLDPVLQ